MDITLENDKLKKAVISILIGAGIMVLNQLFSLLLEFLKTYQTTIVPVVTGMIHFLHPWSTNRTA